MILPSGKPPSLMNRSGPHLGDKADQAGTLNALQWPFPFSERRWTSIQEVSTWSSHITKMNLPNHKLITMNKNGQATFCMWVIYTFKDWRCQNHLKTLSPSNKCSSTAQQGLSNFTFSCTDMMFFSAMTHKTLSRNPLRKTSGIRISSTLWKLQLGTRRYQYHKSQPRRILSSTERFKKLWQAFTRHSAIILTLHRWSWKWMS